MGILSSWLNELANPAYSREWISGATGAGGAILGSLVTIFWTAAYNRGTRKRERREKFAAGAFAAYQRLNHMYSVALQIRDHLNLGEEEARKQGAPVCTRTMPMQRMSGSVTFPLEELWTLTLVGGSALINRVNSLDHSFNHLVESIESYGTLRREVWLKMPTPVSMRGHVGSVVLTPGDMRKIAPDFGALDHLLGQVTPIARAIVDDTFEALTLLVHAKSRPLGKKFKIQTVSPRGEVVVVRAEDAVAQHWWRKRNLDEFPPRAAGV